MVVEEVETVVRRGGSDTGRLEELSEALLPYKQQEVRGERGGRKDVKIQTQTPAHSCTCTCGR